MTVTRPYGMVDWFGTSGKKVAYKMEESLGMYGLGIKYDSSMRRFTVLRSGDKSNDEIQQIVLENLPKNPFYLPRVLDTRDPSMNCVVELVVDPSKKMQAITAQTLQALDIARKAFGPLAAEMIDEMQRSLTKHSFSLNYDPSSQKFAVLGSAGKPKETIEQALYRRRPTHFIPEVLDALDENNNYLVQLFQYEYEEMGTWHENGHGSYRLRKSVAKVHPIAPKKQKAEATESSNPTL